VCSCLHSVVKTAEFSTNAAAWSVPGNALVATFLGYASAAALVTHKKSRGFAAIDTLLGTNIHLHPLNNAGGL
jgi:hypothetical protein